MSTFLDEVVTPLEEQLATKSLRELVVSGNRIRDIGHEYGATTGRPRRCGWFRNWRGKPNPGSRRRSRLHHRVHRATGSPIEDLPDIRSARRYVA